MLLIQMMLSRRIKGDPPAFARRFTAAAKEAVILVVHDNGSSFLGFGIAAPPAGKGTALQKHYGADTRTIIE